MATNDQPITKFMHFPSFYENSLFYFYANILFVNEMWRVSFSCFHFNFIFCIFRHYQNNDSVPLTGPLCIAMGTHTTGWEHLLYGLNYFKNVLFFISNLRNYLSVHVYIYLSSVYLSVWLFAYVCLYFLSVWQGASFIWFKVPHSKT